jgi:hypothetical protein
MSATTAVRVGALAAGAVLLVAYQNDGHLSPPVAIPNTLRHGRGRD